MTSLNLESSVIYFGNVPTNCSFNTGYYAKHKVKIEYNKMNLGESKDSLLSLLRPIIVSTNERINRKVYVTNKTECVVTEL